ncbi:MAG: sigma-54 dependent transcriptional regulator [Pseudomonadota bacterium]
MVSSDVVLVVEDDEALRDAILITLEAENIAVIGVENATEALRVIDTQAINMIITDVQLPDFTGKELLKVVKKTHPTIPILLMTAYSTIEDAVNSIRDGAVDYIAKPFSRENLINKVHQYRQSSYLNLMHDAPIAEATVSKEVFTLAKRLASSNVSVLISGQSGTGKEILARFIHDQSPRKNQPFIAINCAAIPETMLEAILFGHEKGAFTGAQKSMPGKFELADQGTLLLDEITEMPISLQSKLLRVLQEKEVERIGGKEPISIDVRIISTSNRNLIEEIENKRFREDLYYRLNVFPIELSPLHDRKEDILPLAHKLIAKYSSDRSSMPILTAESNEVLLSYDWPGNVRELENVIQRSLVLADGLHIHPKDLLITKNSLRKINKEIIPALNEPGNLGFPESTPSLNQDVEIHEFSLILETLKKEHGHRQRTADRLQISSRTLRYKLAKMKSLGFDIPVGFKF